MTIPLVVTAVLMGNGDTDPLPCNWLIVCVTAQAPGAATVSAKDFVLTCPVESFTWIAKVNGEPATLVGVPKRSPSALNVRNGGSATPGSGDQA